LNQDYHIKELNTLFMLDWSTCSAVERDSEKVSGAWVFKGTRIPVAALFENLEGGASVTDFVEWFPGVSKEQVDAVLEFAAQSLEVV
jgi:uncharacterized protein (DUF433 family)